MVLFCACSYYDLVSRETKSAALARVRAAYGEVRVVADLCGAAARREPVLRDCAAAESLTIVACYPRAVLALFALADAPLDAARVRFVNLREGGFEELPSCEPEASELPEVDAAAEWVPWFPVMDPGRCVHCRQCLEFCLFGVYEQDAEGHVRVTHPEGCKTNCPACARLCPEGAIVFPKYGDAPINGAEIADEAAVRAASRALAEGDLRAALEERRKRRRALLKPEYRPDAGGSGA